MNLNSPKSLFVCLRRCASGAHNTRKKVVAVSGVTYRKRFNNSGTQQQSLEATATSAFNRFGNSQQQFLDAQLSRQVTMFEPNSSALQEGTQDDFQDELEPILFHDRSTLPRDLPPEFINSHILGQSKLLKHLEWKDMIAQRKTVPIPLFYVGSILSVTYANALAAEGVSTFVGRVISRSHLAGLRHSFLLRNVIDGEGVEMTILPYSPRIRNIRCCQLWRWLDEDLRYLRDAHPRYCTIEPQNDKSDKSDEQLKIFEGKVEMNLRPWHSRWERFNLQNVDFSDLRLIDQKRADAWNYYQFDKSMDLFDETTDQVSQEELKEIQKMLASESEINLLDNENSSANDKTILHDNKDKLEEMTIAEAS